MPLSRHHPWASYAGDIDTVDLTLSPSPEPQPRQRPKLQQLSTNIKAGPRSVAPVKTERLAPGPSRRTAPPVEVPQINPDHLARIINTSDAQSVRSVLLDLCKLSPALSGAVARGLTPHSTFAQSTIKEYSRTAGPSKTSAAPSSPIRNSVEKPQFREEWSLSPTPSDEDLDTISTRTPRSSSSPPPARRFKDDPDTPPPRPLKPAPNRSSFVKRSTSKPDFNTAPAAIQTDQKPSFQNKLIHVKQERKPYRHFCTQCNHGFEDEFEVCIYHPGRKVFNAVDGQRLTTYTCCKESVGAPGCTHGSHSVQRYQSTVKLPLSTSPNSGPSKKPRLV